MLRTDMVLVTGPGIGLRCRRQTCAYRIKLDIASTGNETRFRIDNRRTEATFPQRALPAVAVVKIGDIETPHPLHQLGQTRGISGCGQQDDLITEEDISVDGYPKARCCFAQVAVPGLVVG